MSKILCKFIYSGASEKDERAILWAFVYSRIKYWSVAATLAVVSFYFSTFARPHFAFAKIQSNFWRPIRLDQFNLRWCNWWWAKKCRSRSGNKTMKMMMQQEEEVSVWGIELHCEVNWQVAAAAAAAASTATSMTLCSSAHRQLPTCMKLKLKLRRGNGLHLLESTSQLLTKCCLCARQIHCHCHQRQFTPKYSRSKGKLIYGTVKHRLS